MCPGTHARGWYQSSQIYDHLPGIYLFSYLFELIKNRPYLNLHLFFFIFQECPSVYPWLGNAKGKDTDKKDVYEKYEEQYTVKKDVLYIYINQNKQITIINGK